MIRIGAVAAILGLLLAGCSGGGEEPTDRPSSTNSASSSTPTAKPTAATKAPQPGTKACYRLSYDEAVAPTTSREATPCRRSHTAMTFAVGSLDTAVDGHLLAVDSRRVQEQVARACPERLGAFLGGDVADRRLSMLRAVWFTPSVEESDAGANWFRCDVIAVAANQELAPLGGRMAGVLNTDAGRDRYAMCGTAEPGTDGFERVICSDQHSWRALRTVDLGSGRYPGEEKVRSAGDGPCKDAGRAAADDALNFTWGYEWPTRDQWESGQTYGLCWAPE